MKKLFIAFFLLVGSAGILNAQTPQTVHKVNKKTEVKSTEVKAAPVNNKTLKVETVTAKPVLKTKVHTKADGTLDKRFVENKTTKTVKKVPVKKDGTPDMRYKVNKP